MAKKQRKRDEQLYSLRETVESIWIAIVLAIVLRAFVLEAFMIPTGSMAPRLMGKHGQFDCPACGYHYSFGVDQSKNASLSSEIYFPPTRCPSCEYERRKEEDRWQWAYGGDRVLVLKYLYRFREPEPWDVVVFKNPLNNRENYIKRLIGLPGQEIEIVHGDVFWRKAEDFNRDGRIDDADFNDPRMPDWQILEKQPRTQEVMWQIIFDNDYQPDEVVYRAGGQTWEVPWTAPPGRDAWQTERGGRVFRYTGSDRPAELWFAPDPGRFFPNYAYNKRTERDYDRQKDINYDLKLSFLFVPADENAAIGLHLSGFHDHFQAWLGAKGEAVLKHGVADPQGKVTWDKTDWGRDALLPTLRAGRGYEVALTHVDRRVTLWLDGKPLLASPAGYTAKKEEIKSLVEYTLKERSQLPVPRVGILARGGRCELWHVKLMRDVYYTCANLVLAGDVRTEHLGHGTTGNPMRLRRFYNSPDMDEFFVLGDNSPASKDSRMWGSHAPTLRQPYRTGTVPRYNLMGKALFVYWPGGHRLQMLKQLPVVPNVGRMRLIR